METKHTKGEWNVFRTYIMTNLPNVKDFSDLVKEYPKESMFIFTNALQTLNKNEI